MRVSLVLSLLSVAIAVTALPAANGNAGAVAGGLSHMKRDDPPANSKPTESRPPPPPEHPPSDDSHKEEHKEAPQPPKDTNEHPKENNGDHGPRPEPNNQPVHQHIEHIEHPGGNPNNIDHFTHDIVNDDKNGVHSNIVQHVSVSGNNIKGKPAVKVVEGDKGIVVNGKGNKVVLPDGFWKQFGPDGSLIITH
ncbi:hypothetical protein H4R20_003889 [Coemansia guatemalensis]|uniref:Uncharacterized protein n=1 Tax=Coemansia guatemalensis TaxID=2761395 RepID=A0A9W8LTA5_9FUNG|nr:hypothetical protein H4R20_003889 [Coemansia guatemalensis]